MFPKLWNARTVRFYAGLELNIFNYALSVIASLRRLFLLEPLPRCAPLFLNLSLMLYSCGSKNGALAVWLSGKNHNSQRIERKIAIVTDDDGPATPSSAAIVLTKRILEHGPPALGAFPCVGFLTLDEIMAHSKRTWRQDRRTPRRRRLLLFRPQWLSNRILLRLKRTCENSSSLE